MRGTGGGGKSVLILHSAVSLCGVADCCKSSMGGIHAPVFLAGSGLVAGVGTVSGRRVLEKLHE